MAQLLLKSLGAIEDSAYLETSQDLTVGPGQVLVQMLAAPINPVDTLFANGWYGVQPVLPAGLGTEGAGRVVEAGAGVNRDLVGRQVVLLGTNKFGTWADRLVLDATDVVAVSNEIDPHVVATLGVNPATAYLLLHRYVGLVAGDWIGINLGNSAIGQAITALAKHQGLKVLSVVRSEAAAKQVGQVGKADLVVVDGNDLAERIAAGLGGSQLRLVLDGAGDATVAALAQSLEFGGTVVGYSSVSGQSSQAGLGEFVFKELVVRGFWVVNWLRNASRDEIEEVYGELAHLAATGVLATPVDATYPLEQWVDALEHSRRPGRTGKVLLTFPQ